MIKYYIKTLPRIKQYEKELVELCREKLNIMILNNVTNPYELVWPTYALIELGKRDIISPELEDLKEITQRLYVKALSENDYKFHTGFMRLLHLLYHGEAKLYPEYLSKVHKMYYTLLRINRRAAYELGLAITSIDNVKSSIDLEQLKENITKEVNTFLRNKNSEKLINPGLLIAYLELSNDLELIRELAKKLENIIELAKRNPIYCSLAAKIIKRTKPIAVKAKAKYYAKKVIEQIAKALYYIIRIILSFR